MTESFAWAWRQDIAKINRRLDSLEPTSRLPPISSPVRGKDFVREPNVSALMLSAIENHNAMIPAGKEQYIQFPANASDKKLNSDAKDALERIMIEKLGEGYGSLSWATASSTTHFAQCEAVIQSAAKSTDFLVFRQSSNFWSIRWLAEQKMKSKGRPPKPSKRRSDHQMKLTGPPSRSNEYSSERNTIERNQQNVIQGTADVRQMNPEATIVGFNCANRARLITDENSREVQATGASGDAESIPCVLDQINTGCRVSQVLSQNHRPSEDSNRTFGVGQISRPEIVTGRRKSMITNATEIRTSIPLRLRIKSASVSTLQNLSFPNEIVPRTNQIGGVSKQREDVSTTVTAPCHGHKTSGLVPSGACKNAVTSTPFGVPVRIPVRDRGKRGTRGIGRGRGTGLTARGAGRSSKGRRGMKTVIVRGQRGGIGSLTQVEIQSRCH